MTKSAYAVSTTINSGRMVLRSRSGRIRAVAIWHPHRTLLWTTQSMTRKQLYRLTHQVCSMGCGTSFRWAPASQERLAHLASTSRRPTKLSLEDEAELDRSARAASGA